MNIREGLGYIKRGILCLIITAGICVGLLILTSCISTSVIEKSVKDSSEYFLKNELFMQLRPGYAETTCDNYADCIWINIIYEIDTRKPFASAIKAEYAYEENENVNTTLKRAVSAEGKGRIEKISYNRYWHGSMVLIRPLLILGDVQVVRGILAAITAILFGYNVLILYKRYSKSASLYYLLAFGIVQGYVMFHCINYVMNFLIVNVMLLLLEKKIVQRDEAFYCFMTAGGIVTCFCDFLTTETVTLTLPLVIYLLIRQKEAEKLNEPRLEPVKCVVVSLFSWGTGYSFMFLFKWLLVYLFLGKEELVSSLQQANMRIQDGNVFLALCNNIAAMFHLKQYEFQRYGMFLAIGFVILASVIFLVTVKQGNAFINAMILVSLIPYLRYGMIKNHSQIHYFFTYRAQITTLLVLLLCMESIWKEVKTQRSEKQSRK